eukprot:scaffold1364_cov116-Isochrysis_galbana.AAC.2
MSDPALHCACACASSATAQCRLSRAGLFCLLAVERDFRPRGDWMCADVLPASLVAVESRWCLRARLIRLQGKLGPRAALLAP